jgi:hypothetical protein
MFVCLSLLCVWWYVVVSQLVLIVEKIHPKFSYVERPKDPLFQD